MGSAGRFMRSAAPGTVRGETLFIQIRNKSMLMNQKSGQRLVDDCVHPSQLQAMSSN